MHHGMRSIGTRCSSRRHDADGEHDENVIKSLSEFGDWDYFSDFMANRPICLLQGLSMIVRVEGR